MTAKPNPILHMMLWGAVGGFVLFMIIIGIVSTSEGLRWLLRLVSPYSWTIAFVMGSIPAAFIGFLQGLLMWGMLHDIGLPLTIDKIRSHRRSVYLLVLISSLIVVFIWSWSVIDSLTLEWIISGLSADYSAYKPLLWLICLVLAPTFATVAAHRYLMRVFEWSKQFDKRKVKAKNDYLPRKRLADTSYSDAMLEDELTDRAKHNYQ